MESILVLLKQTIVLAPPVLITAVGGCMSELSGVTNLGLEGMMLSGAFASAAVNYFTGNPYLAMLVGTIIGGLISCIHAFISIHLKGDQIVSGVAINLFALATTSFLIKTLFNVAGTTPQAKSTAQVGIVLPIIYILAIILYLVVYKTVFGLRLRTVGEHPLAADTVGISVYKYRYCGVIISGLCAGLGGSYMSTVILQQFVNNMSAGRGYIAIAAMIFGKWNPLGAILASLLFAFGQSFSDYSKAISLDIPQQFLSMIPYVITLIVLIGFIGKARAPKAVGKPYEK